MFSLLPTTLRVLLASLLWTKNPPSATSSLRFQLRHEHAVSNTSLIIFSDVAPSFTADSYGVNTRPVLTHKPSSDAAFSRARLRSLRHMQSELLQWHDEEVVGPDVENRETLLQLAKMTSNSYFEPVDKEWYDLGPRWNNVRGSVCVG